MTEKRFGFIAVIGPPNAGKSTSGTASRRFVRSAGGVGALVKCELSQRGIRV